MFKKRAKKKKKAPKKPQKHTIHRALKWQKMIDEGEVKSLSEIAKKEGLTRARVTQIMNLLKLPPTFQLFLFELKDPDEIRKYSEKKLRSLIPALPPYDNSEKSADEIISSLIHNQWEAAGSSPPAYRLCLITRSTSSR